ncbi:hypothetical protein LRS71_09455 [Rhodococcus pyridinivorans]|uniref:hypothetical protein n=1 Tax=Rhodococcus pyridinivorans TaxID=103816 RepID=UPI001E3DD95A|nr:hypothetical protein [Rhodococcus pyridinivorans]MCD5419779.1 hypothetical protein [Rhodococcus pyridinivorans]
MASFERAPKACPNGHRLGPNRVIVGWTPCTCAPGITGHRTYTCRECNEVVERPPHVGDAWFGVQWS